MSDFNKLGALGTEGRSSAISTVSMSTIRKLRGGTSTTWHKKCWYSAITGRRFASGRTSQDMRFMITRAQVFSLLEGGRNEGIPGSEIALRVVQAMGLTPADYSTTPDAKFGAADEANRAFQQTMSHHIHADLQRGWRFTSPNLEQTGQM